MSHTFTTRGNRQYRYYTCTNAVKRGRAACPSGSLPAIEIEAAVVDQIRCVGRDPALVHDTVEATQRQQDEAIGRLMAERRAVERGLAHLHAEIARASASHADRAETADRLANLAEQISVAERRLSEIAVRLAALETGRIDPPDVTAALADFDNVWGALSPREQARVLQLLVARVEYDAADSSIEITFHETEIKSLAGQAAGATEEEAA